MKTLNQKMDKNKNRFHVKAVTVQRHNKHAILYHQDNQDPTLYLSGYLVLGAQLEIPATCFVVCVKVTGRNIVSLSSSTPGTSN